MLLLRNKDQEYNNRLASFATASAGKGSDMSELRSCGKRCKLFKDLMVTTLP